MRLAVHTQTGRLAFYFVKLRINLTVGEASTTLDQYLIVPTTEWRSASEISDKLWVTGKSCSNLE